MALSSTSTAYKIKDVALWAEPDMLGDSDNAVARGALDLTADLASRGAASGWIGHLHSRIVVFDRRLLITTLLGAALFLWPLLVYGRASSFQDSTAYYHAGRKAVTFVLNKLEPPHVYSSSVPGSPGSQPSAGLSADEQTRQTRGSRSVAYSVAAYLLGWPQGQMWLLVVAQAVAAGFVCAVGLLLFGENVRGAAAKFAVLAVATPVAFVACLLIPDLFAGLSIFIIALIATAYRSLSPGVRAASVILASAGIAFHTSHLPLGLGVTAMAAGWLLACERGRRRIGLGQWTALLAPFLVGAIATMSMNSVAFGGASLTGKRYPLTLARSVAEGPAKRYLDKNCGHLRYAICEIYPHGVPSTVDDFVFGKNGVVERATLEQLDRIRAEEAEVVLAATKAYPLQEISRLAYQITRQLGIFHPGLGLHMRIVMGADGNPVSVRASYDPTWARLVAGLSIVGVLASLALLFSRWRTLGELRPMVGLVLFGILLNAAICVYFSGVSERYQARVVWLIPLLGLMALGPIEQRIGAHRGSSPA